MSDDLEQLIEEIKSDIITGMNAHNIPGLSIAIVDKEGILWSEGFGFTDESKTQNVTSDTLFMIGSLSKAYNVLGFLRALQKGLIHLDDPLKKYYPEFKWNTRFGKEEVDKITFRHLLTHYAGLPHFTQLKSSTEDIFLTFEEYIAKINDCWQICPVGTRFSYSNAGVDLAAYVLQIITGKSYAEYIRDEVYLPLSMMRSTVEPAKALIMDNHARGFSGKKQKSIDDTLMPCLGAGAQFSSVNDMAKMLQMHFNNGFVGSERFLEEELLEEIYTIPFAEIYELSKIGLGIGISKNSYGGELELGFFGDGPGYVNRHSFYPKLGIGWLLQANQNQDIFPFLFKLSEKVDSAIVKYKLGNLPESITITDEVVLPKEIKLSEDKVNRLLGKYISRMVNIEIENKNGKLVFTLQGEEHQLKAHSESEFSTEKIPLICFDYDKTGRPKTIKLVSSKGRITVLDYDSGPLDGPGPNKNKWMKYHSMYRVDFQGMAIYSTTFTDNGHLYLVTNFGNKTYRLTEYKDGIFFTADGQRVQLSEKQIKQPISNWHLDDISLEKIKLLLKDDPENIRVKKKSLEALAFIYKATYQKDILVQLEKIINETYPSDN